MKLPPLPCQAGGVSTTICPMSFSTYGFGGAIPAALKLAALGLGIGLGAISGGDCMTEAQLQTYLIGSLLKNPTCQSWENKRHKGNPEMECIISGQLLEIEKMRRVFLPND